MKAAGKKKTGLIVTIVVILLVLAAGAFKEGENEVVIRVVNNWNNRIVGDCALPAGQRVTRSTVRYWNKSRTNSVPGNIWTYVPTLYSGCALSDPLQPSGLLGPVEIR